MTNKLLTHPSITHAQDLAEICKPLSIFNITSFANARIDSQGGFSSLCNQPDYLLHYIAKGYHYADVSARKNKFDLGNYLIWDLMECYAETEKMLNDAAEFHYRHIFTIIKPGENHTDFYHFGTHLNSPKINQWYVNHLNELSLFIDYFNEKISQSKDLSLGYDITISMIDQPENCHIKLDPTFDYLHQKKQEFQDDISKRRGDKSLSFRQIECLKLLVKGYSAKAIAKELHLSPRTIEDYLSILKSKLQTKNLAELIAKALQKQIC